MRRWIVIFVFCGFLNTLSAKEWKSLKAYQNETHNEVLTPTDWLKQDRTRNTIVWQQANVYNLSHDLQQEYLKIRERRDFYKWLYTILKKKGHEVVWVEMAHFISKKMRLLEMFPCNIFSNRKIVYYANQGSESVFNNAFQELKDLFNSKIILKEDSAIQWDQKMAYKEQYVWLDSLYQTIDANSLKIIEHMAKGKFIYGLVVPKSIRFKGKISNPNARYTYAITSLRKYCVNTYQ